MKFIVCLLWNKANCNGVRNKTCYIFFLKDIYSIRKDIHLQSGPIRERCNNINICIANLYSTVQHTEVVIDIHK